MKPPKTKNGLVQMIRMDKSTGSKKKVKKEENVIITIYSFIQQFPGVGIMAPYDFSRVSRLDIKVKKRTSGSWRQFLKLRESGSIYFIENPISVYIIPYKKKLVQCLTSCFFICWNCNGNILRFVHQSLQISPWWSPVFCLYFKIQREIKVLQLFPQELDSTYSNGLLTATSCQIDARN